VILILRAWIAAPTRSQQGVGAALRFCEFEFMPKKKTELDRFAELHAMMIGSPHEGERNAARQKLDAWLKKRGKTWNDVPELLAQHYARVQAAAPPPTDPRDASSADPHPF
jgi:hypothetical protein